jgi:hypothetical protein
MNIMIIRSLLMISTLTLAACSSVEDKQLEACINDVKKGLNDPSSLEVLDTDPHERTNGTYLLIMQYTAKNSYGGRVRASASCGFKTKNDTALNPDELQNQLREIQRNFAGAGIKLN